MIGILLAAGRGTRMKSDVPKVLFHVNDEPLCFAPLAALIELCEKVVVVIGYRGADVQVALTQRATEVFGEDAVKTKLVFHTQNPPRGTGDAVRTAVEGFGKSFLTHDEVLIANGDLPLLRKHSLERLVQQAHEQKLSSACISIRQADARGLGRILRDDQGTFAGIREEKDASTDERKIREVNGGVYFFKTALLSEGVGRLTTKNQQQEFYLTDLLGNKTGQISLRSEAVLFKNPWDLLGVNTTFELAGARKLAQSRWQKKLCEDFGVDFENPDTTFVSARAKFLGACSIGPGTVILGKTQIDKGVVIEGNCRIHDSKIFANAQILWGSAIEGSLVGAAAKIGPMAHLRPGSELGAEVRIGNFVELKKTKMGDRSKASHLSYLGDAQVGEDANVGCGSITCNFDGFNKYPTKIGARAFIGSDTQLIAPVTIGDEAYVASGTTVTQDVPAGALALSRPELILKPGYAKRLTEKLQIKNKKKS